MTLENKKKILFNFLNKHNLTESFNNNVIMFYQIGEEDQEVCEIVNGKEIYFESVDDYINHAPLFDVFYGIGCWDETDEGVEFWYDVNKKWINLISRRNIMIEKFFEFLKENGVYDRYMECSAKHTGVHQSCIEDVVTSELKATPVNDYVSCMFFWDGTMEGHKYWLHLHNKWNCSL